MNKSAVNINYLLGNTPLSIRQKSKDVAVEFIKQMKDRWIYKVGDYIVRIRIPKIPLKVKKTSTETSLSKMTKIKNRDLFVSCTCNFWKYNGPDYNAIEQGYSERSFSNLQSPDTRDPNKEFLICKHVYKVLRHFRQNFKTAD